MLRTVECNEMCKISGQRSFFGKHAYCTAIILHRNYFSFNVISGDLVSVYTSLGYHHAVSDVQFHPLDHIIAFCSFGDSHPVLVYHYDAKGWLCFCLLKSQSVLGFSWSAYSREHVVGT